ncbi:nuclear transport factor 2 family protein [Rhodococcus aetherivorans]
MESTRFTADVADKIAIMEQIYRYCRSVDRLDVPLGHSVFHEKSYVDYGPGVYKGDGRGVIDYICQAHSEFLSHSHQVSNILIDIDGDRAGSEAYVTATLRTGDPARPREIRVYGRYIDSWSRREEKWGIDRRDVVIDFDSVSEVSPVQTEVRGTRDQSDPSYQVFLHRP